MLILVFYSKKEGLKQNRFVTVAKIYGLWFINLVFWLITALGFHLLFVQQLKKQFNLSGPDGEATLAAFEIWIAVILSLVSTWLIIKWKN